MPRKLKWTNKDQVALETLVKRHGAAMVTNAAGKYRSAWPASASTKRRAGRSKGYSADALSVVWLSKFVANWSNRLEGAKWGRRKSVGKSPRTLPAYLPGAL